MGVIDYLSMPGSGDSLTPESYCNQTALGAGAEE